MILRDTLILEPVAVQTCRCSRSIKVVRPRYRPAFQICVGCNDTPGNCFCEPFGQEKEYYPWRAVHLNKLRRSS